MFQKIVPLVALSALLISTGCKKDVKSDSTSTLATQAKASYSGLGSYQLTSIHDRAIALDFAGTGKNYVFVYRVGQTFAGEDWYNLMQYNNSSNSWTQVLTSPPGGGIGQFNGSNIYPLTSAPSSDPNNYNEIGGDHVIAFDWNASFHRRLRFLANVTKPTGANPVFRTRLGNKNRTTIPLVQFAEHLAKRAV